MSSCHKSVSVPHSSVATDSAAAPSDPVNQVESITRSRSGLSLLTVMACPWALPRPRSDAPLRSRIRRPFENSLRCSANDGRPALAVNHQRLQHVLIRAAQLHQRFQCESLHIEPAHPPGVARKRKRLTEKDQAPSALMFLLGCIGGDLQSRRNSGVGHEQMTAGGHFHAPQRICLV